MTTTPDTDTNIPICVFTATPGSVNSRPSDTNPINYFEMFLSAVPSIANNTDVWGILATMTNRYAQQYIATHDISPYSRVKA